VKLICLNIWGGKIHDKLLDFIKQQTQDADIFCFQEVFDSDRKTLLSLNNRSNNLNEILTILSDFNYFYFPVIEGEDVRKKVDFPLSFGQATFVKKSLNVLKNGDIYTYRSYNKMGLRYANREPDFPKNFIFCEVEKGNKKFLVLNFHGYWEPAPKYDTKERMKQSEMIISFIRKYGLPAIIAGDFNLAMDTKSVNMFSENGFRNLVKESGAKTTRSTYYDYKWRKTDKYADYIFTSGGIWVNDFKVLSDEVSDHLPLYLEFNV